MFTGYLHGFASSPGSVKARFFADRLRPHGVPLWCPDLNAPSFSTLTFSRMLAQVDDCLSVLAPQPVTLIGSSLGGALAWFVADRHRRPAVGPPQVAWVHRLVLLAPAFDFVTSSRRQLGIEGLARWRQEGWLSVHHHAHGAPRPLHYAFYEDARRFDAARVHCPVDALVFQGRRDTTVEPETVQRVAAAQPRVRLVLLDDDHRLQASLDEIWRTTAVFLGLEEAPAGPAR